MRANPTFAEVPAPRRWDFQYRWYVIALLAVATILLFSAEWLIPALVVAPAVAVGLTLWLIRLLWRRRVQAAPPRLAPDPRIRIGWSRASNPQYAGRGSTLFPHGAFGGGMISDGYASLPLAIAATILLLPALLAGVVIGLALRVKRHFQPPPTDILKLG